MLGCSLVVQGLEQVPVMTSLQARFVRQHFACLMAELEALTKFTLASPETHACLLPRCHVISTSRILRDEHMRDAHPQWLIDVIRAVAPPKSKNLSANEKLQKIARLCAELLLLEASASAPNFEDLDMLKLLNTGNEPFLCG